MWIAAETLLWAKEDQPVWPLFSHNTFSLNPERPLWPQLVPVSGHLKTRKEVTMKLQSVASRPVLAVFMAALIALFSYGCESGGAEGPTEASPPVGSDVDLGKADSGGSQNTAAQLGLSLFYLSKAEWAVVKVYEVNEMGDKFYANIDGEIEITLEREWPTYVDVTKGSTCVVEVIDAPPEFELEIFEVVIDNDTTEFDFDLDFIPKDAFLWMEGKWTIYYLDNPEVKATMECSVDDELQLSCWYIQGSPDYPNFRMSVFYEDIIADYGTSGFALRDGDTYRIFGELPPDVLNGLYLP